MDIGHNSFGSAQDSITIDGNGVPSDEAADSSDSDTSSDDEGSSSGKESSSGKDSSSDEDDSDETSSDDDDVDNGRLAVSSSLPADSYEKILG